jgi:hypothetical protein
MRITTDDVQPTPAQQRVFERIGEILKEEKDALHAEFLERRKKADAEKRKHIVYQECEEDDCDNDGEDDGASLA